MFKIAALIWIMLGTALAGAFVLAAVTVPELAAKAGQSIAAGAAAGFVLAMPLAWLIARKILAATRSAA